MKGVIDVHHGAKKRPWDDKGPLISWDVGKIELVIYLCILKWNCPDVFLFEGWKVVFQPATQVEGRC